MKKQIVVVEDNISIREMIEYILEDHQIEVVSFATAGDFRDAMADINPNLYLLDIMLPDGNGTDLCRELKANPKSRETPVIMMSAHFGQGQIECGAEDFIEKPFDIDDLISRIEHQIA